MLPGTILTASLLASALCLWKGLCQPRMATTRIDQIRLGANVPAENPTGENDLSLGDRVDPETWREIRLRAPKVDGTFADVKLLRPRSWLHARGVRVGETLQISVPECGIESNAEVLWLGPCPPIQPGPGRTVTGIFRHESAQVIDLRVEGLAQPIGTTANHPFWSADRQRFVRADQLRPCELLRTMHRTRAVRGYSNRSKKQPVFNLEVQCAHVYHIADAGILVHNGGGNLLTILCPEEVEADRRKLARQDAFQGMIDEGLIGRRNVDHHGTPSQIINEAEKLYGVDPKDIRGKRGQPNIVSVDSYMHDAAHYGWLGKPKYNPEFQQRLAKIESDYGGVTASDYWSVRADMLLEYFGLHVD